MSATIHMHPEFDRVSFECEDDAPTIWIRSKTLGNTVSIDLTKRYDRIALRAALDAADAIADKT